MSMIPLSRTAFRPKLQDRIDDYLCLSPAQSLTIGIYKDGTLYVLGDPEAENGLLYDIGSISKTFTAHLILKLCDERKLELDKTVDRYLPLKKGNYPTLYQLLTHTAGYHHITPAEVTVPALLLHRYANKNPYESCSAKTVADCLSRRRGIKTVSRYGYSDFAYAVLASVAEQVAGTPFADLLEEFIRKDLGLKSTVLEADPVKRFPLSAKGKKIPPFWVWKRGNPYIAAGGTVTNVDDMLRYVALQIESDLPYIKNAHNICEESAVKKDNHLMCIGWHTYKRSNQLWHVGGVGTFRSSIIFNKKRRLGVVVLGNSKGKNSANVHYLAKMLYSELKINKIDLQK